MAPLLLVLMFHLPAASTDAGLGASVTHGTSLGTGGSAGDPNGIKKESGFYLLKESGQYLEKEH